MQKLVLYIIPLAVAIGFTSCTVDPEPIGITGEPTPYELKVPTSPYMGTPDIPADNPLTVEGVELGRMLFYEKKLSGDNTMSCGSCHRQELAFTDGKATTAGIDGISGTRSTMSIVNAVWDHHFFWDGRSATLEQQALLPIGNPIELNESLGNVIKKLEATEEYPNKFQAAFGTKEITPDLIAKAIAQFERTMISSNSRYDQWFRGEVQFTDQELRGFNLFSTHPVPGSSRGGNCADCHFGYNFLNQSFKNNGVDSVIGLDRGRYDLTGDSADLGLFKVVSLRNIELTAPYMHDGRFKTLEEVLDHYNDTSLFYHENVDFQILQGNNPGPTNSLNLSEQEKEDIIAFLKTLTDTSFINNPELSDPFEE